MEPRRFITAFTSARHLSLSCASSIQSTPPTSHFLKIHLNIILPSTSGSPKWSSFLQASPPKPCIRLSCAPYALHAPPISFFSILSPGQYWVRSTDHSVRKQYTCILYNNNNNNSQYKDRIIEIQRMRNVKQMW